MYCGLNVARPHSYLAHVCLSWDYVHASESAAYSAAHTSFRDGLKLSS